MVRILAASSSPYRWNNLQHTSLHVSARRTAGARWIRLSMRARTDHLPHRFLRLEEKQHLARQAVLACDCCLGQPPRSQARMLGFDDLPAFGNVLREISQLDGAICGLFEPPTTECHLRYSITMESRRAWKHAPMGLSFSRCSAQADRTDEFMVVHRKAARSKTADFRDGFELSLYQ